MYVDQTKTPQQRNFLSQQKQYYRGQVNFNDAGIGTGVAFGALPQGAFITAVMAWVTTAFNAATTNVFTLGTTKANANEISASGTINPATLGFVNGTAAAGLGMAVTATGPVTLYVKYAQTGAAATAGALTFLIEYCLNNDL